MTREITMSQDTGDNDKNSIVLAPGAGENAFATMLADLVRQNLESKPHKKKDFDTLDGTVALIADDADVSLTLEFKASRRGGRLFGRSKRSRGSLTIHDGIKGIPDVAVRGSADAIMGLSNVPLTRPFALPLPTDRMSLDATRSMLQAMRTGDLKIYGLLRHMGLMSRLTRVMSVNG